MKENKDDQLLSLKFTEKIEFSYYKDTFLNLYNKCKMPIFILLMGFCLLSNIAFGMHYVSISNLFITSNNWDNYNFCTWIFSYVSKPIAMHGTLYDCCCSFTICSFNEYQTFLKNNRRMECWITRL